MSTIEPTDQLIAAIEGLREEMQAVNEKLDLLTRFQFANLAQQNIGTGTLARTILEDRGMTYEKKNTAWRWKWKFYPSRVRNRNG